MTQTLNIEEWLGKRFGRSDSLVSRVIAGHLLLVPIRRRVNDVDNMYTINDVGARAWELIDGTRKLNEIAGRIIEEYDVTPDEAHRDLIEFVAKLVAIGALKEQ